MILIIGSEHVVTISITGPVLGLRLGYGGFVPQRTQLRGEPSRVT
jgi:hypothetical protein